MPDAVSVIVPVTPRANPLAAIYREYAAPLRDAGHPVEFLFILPTAAFAQAADLEQLRDAGEPIRVLRVAQAAEPGMLLRVGVTRAQHEVLLILPPYRRVVAPALPALVAALTRDVDAVFASRQLTTVGFFTRWRRGIYNRLARMATRGSFDDLSCGVGVVRADVLSETPVYGEFLRFLPLLLQREGFVVTAVPVDPHPADHRIRVHRPGSYLRAVVDLLGYYFLSRFTERPLRFFGLIGLASGAVGLLVLGVLLLERLQGQGIANRPALLFGTLLLVLGIQSIAVGLVAEIIVHLSAPTRRPYRLSRAMGSERGAAP